ncbi:hypothetical protein CROQUDRAFT_92931 [Cronartium quercuum f. sp. fusiforme G11]|uniref:Uncharacterized protein n=1 Tax=Cronartium quercuum f. sp. fusiforme G11 TaxID=708437 RepID=A0A9P6NHZ6_9BASI|nr:hypothetical protein CROQUDRAFT_92931 [Cronartium quercuum f. sp. fusiforme G11]
MNRFLTVVMKDDDETFSSFPNTIELIVATSKSLYINYFPIDESNLIAGHLAYQEADYVIHNAL